MGRLRLARAVVAVVAVASFGGACGVDGVRVTGTVTGRPVRAVGTIAAWVDRTAYVEDGDELLLTDRPDDQARLHVRCFEPVFDPSVSFDALSTPERAALEEELARGDSIAVAVERGVALRAGDVVRTVEGDGVPEVLPWISAASLALRDGGRGGADYPSILPSTTIGADAAELAVTDVESRLEGVLTLTAGDDELFVEFAAKLIPERIAECNFARDAAGAVDACTLAPRATIAPAQ